jgi:hypothetical protein
MIRKEARVQCSSLYFGLSKIQVELCPNSVRIMNSPFIKVFDTSFDHLTNVESSFNASTKRCASSRMFMRNSVAEFEKEVVSLDDFFFAWESRVLNKA